MKSTGRKNRIIGTGELRRQARRLLLGFGHAHVTVDRIELGHPPGNTIDRVIGY